MSDDGTGYYWVSGNKKPRGQPTRNMAFDDEYEIDRVYTGEYEDAYTNQEQLGQDYMASIQSGEGSVAQQQLYEGLGRSQRAAYGQAQSRGANPMAMRSAIQTGQEQSLQYANRAAQLRAGEMQVAQQQMMDVYSRDAQAQLAVQQMEMQRKIAQAQHHAEMGEEDRLNREADRRFGMQIAGMAMQGAGLLALSDVRAKQGYGQAPAGGQDDLLMALQSSARGLDYNSNAQRSQEPNPEEADTGILSGLMSDDDAKRLAYEAGRADQERLIQGIRGYTFEYTPQAQQAYGVPAGQRYGVMADDLERAGPMGQAMVQRGPDGMKAIDGKQAIGGLLALSGRLGERDEEVDAAAKKRDVVLARELMRVKQQQDTGALTDAEVRELERLLGSQR